MTRLAVTYPDPEPLVVAYLEDLLAETAHDFDGVTVSKNIPASFDPTDKTQPLHLQVALDGVPQADHPVMWHCTVRVIAWAPTGRQSLAIRGAAFAQGLLLANNGTGGISSTSFLTGPLPARDPETAADIAATTTRVTVRSQPIEPFGS